MASLDIKNHFKGLRVQTASRRRRDPFATGFEDDSDDDRQRRSRAKPPPAATSPGSVAAAPSKPEAAPVKAPVKPTSDEVSPFHAIDALQDSGDDDLMTVPRHRSTERRHSPNPAHPSSSTARAAPSPRRRNSLDADPARRDPRDAIALAAGSLAYLDDSDDDFGNSTTSRRRADRRGYSPGPRKQSDSVDPLARSSTPRGTRTTAPAEQIQTLSQPPRHTVASPFAGTKYLQDSDSDEEAVSSRQGSTDNIHVSELGNAQDDFDDLTPYESAFAANRKKHLEVKRVDKPKQSGSGVSWRAFSAGRNEQRSAEIDALQVSLKQRGKSISFGTHAVTDDGKRVPIPARDRHIAEGTGRAQLRGKSPPRRIEDIKPDDDEVASTAVSDPVDFKTDSFSGKQEIQSDDVTRATRYNETSNTASPQRTSQTSVSTMSPTYDDDESSPTSPTTSNAMTESVDSILSRLIVSPQTIPEHQTIEHSMLPTMSPIALERPLSRSSSTRSTRQASSRTTRPSQPRRPSRRSTSNNASASPAAAFLSSWGSRDGRTAESIAEPKPDDEGQAIGLNNEYIIGRRINKGGFGVVKEVHSINAYGERTVAAVKIVRKLLPGSDEMENEKAQQDLEHEVSVWRHLKHRHILSLTVVHDTDFATFCVMDLNVGGTLFDVLRSSRAEASRNDGRKGPHPSLAKSYAFQLACALRYLHEDIRVCHRDVKLENCLIDLTSPNTEMNGGTLRLCDFGLADFLQTEHDLVGDATDHMTSSHGDLTSSIIGTLEYASPRGLVVHRKLYETAGDVWAFGVIVYALCTGELPFRHSMPSRTVEMILDGEWDDAALRQATAGSDAVIELVKGCLERDIDLRMTIGEAMRSPWFIGCGKDDEDSGGGTWG